MRQRKKSLNVQDPPGPDPVQDLVLMIADVGPDVQVIVVQDQAVLEGNNARRLLHHPEKFALRD